MNSQKPSSTSSLADDDFRFWYPSTLPLIKAAGALAFVGTLAFVKLRLKGRWHDALTGATTFGAGSAVATALLTQRGAVEEKEAVRRFYLQRASVVRSQAHRAQVLEGDSSFLDELTRLAEMEDENEAVRQYLASLVKYDLPLVLKREGLAAAFAAQKRSDAMSEEEKHEEDALAMGKFLLSGMNGSGSAEAAEDDKPAPLR